MEIKIRNISKLIYYVTTNDRETVISEITEFLNDREELGGLCLEDIEQFIEERTAKREDGTKYDKKDQNV